MNKITYILTRTVRSVLAALVLLAGLLGGAAPTPAQAAPTCTTSGATVTCTFNYTGAPETWTVPAGVTQATFDLYGAEGGRGGPGGRMTATLAVTQGTTYQILVGGQGMRNGFNGGGAPGGFGSYAGGGASDVRTGAFGLADRLLVAGGGGGSAGSAGGTGGAGGYPQGGNGSNGLEAAGGQGGSQTAGGAGGFGALFGGNGSLGQGGDGAAVELGGGGGGGGYYGGGGGGDYEGTFSGGGGGGSSYASPAATSVSFENGVRNGDGLVIISYEQGDNTVPTASPTQSPAANSAGWNNSDVTVSWNWADEAGGSGLDPANCITSTTSSGEGVLTLNATCQDVAGNSNSATYTVMVDKTAPTLNPVVSPNPVPVGGTATASPNASDALSGIASQSCDAVDTSTVGSKTIICTATDNAGNASSASVSYSVIYNFAGFFSPVDNLPVLNTVKTGQAIPVRFSLGGDQGLDIFAAGYPKVQQIACDSSAPGDAIEETVTSGNSGLQYDPTTNTYTYVWKTQKSWAGTCRQLIVRLTDGTEHVASFKFK
jgi:hypothetical protein